MRILGIETSCDETAISLIDVHEKNRTVEILGNTVHSQIDLHAAHGGVFPVLAKREHELSGKARLPADDIDGLKRLHRGNPVFRAHHHHGNRLLRGLDRRWQELGIDQELCAFFHLLERESPINER